MSQGIIRYSITHAYSQYLEKRGYCIQGYCIIVYSRHNFREIIKVTQPTEKPEQKLECSQKETEKRPHFATIAEKWVIMPGTAASQRRTPRVRRNEEEKPTSSGF